MAFDIDEYAATSVPVRYEDLDLTVFRDDPLPADTLRCLRYMCDVEYHTVCYLRDLLVTPSSREHDVAGFMTMWNREEFWHGEALAAVLAEHDVTVDYDELKAKRTKLGWREALSSLKQSVLAGMVGKDFVATHMLWGAANEWSAVAAYRRLADLEKHPVLAVLLRRIAQQETRHVAFYASQARTRLAASEPARRVARLTLEKFWRPVGTSIMGSTEVRHVMGHLFAGAEGRAEVARIDRTISRLPGMTGVRVFQDALDKEGVAA